MVSSIHPKELKGHYNLSLVMFQLGQYDLSMAPLQVILGQTGGALNSF